MKRKVVIGLAYISMLKRNKKLKAAIALGCLMLTPSAYAAQEDQDSVKEFSLEPVTVEAKRPDWESKLSPGTVTVIKPETFSGEQKDLPAMLKQVPGIFVREINGKGQYTTVSVRGSTAAQVGVFVDGVLTNLGGDAAADISAIPVSNIERIEVYRGYIPVRFGGTYMGGVINIVTKKPEKADISLETGISSHGGRNYGLELTAPLSTGTLLFGLNREQSDGDFKYTNFAAESYGGDGTRYRKYNDFNNTDAIIKWQDDNWMIKGSYKKVDRHLPDNLWPEGSIANAYDPGAKTDLADINLAEGKRQTVDSKELLVSRRAQAGNLEWGWSLNYLDQDKNYRVEKIKNPYFSYWSTPLRAWSAYDSTRWGGKLDGSYKLDDHNLIEFLASYSKEKMNVDGSNLATANSNYDSFRNYYEQKLLNIQLQDTVTLDKEGTWQLTPNIRYNRSEILGRSHRDATSGHSWVQKEETQSNGKTTWQLAVKKEFNENFSMRATGGTYYRLLNLYEIAGDGAGILPPPKDKNASGTAYPLPEEGKQFDVSGLWRNKWFGSDASSLTLTYFWRDSDNMLQLSRRGYDYWCYFNDNKGKVYGLEMQNNYSWKKFDLNLYATYTKSKLQRQDSAYADYGPEYTQGYKDIWATYQPEWQTGLRLTNKPSDKFDIYAELKYRDEMFTNAVKDKRGGHYAYESGAPVRALTTVDLGVKFKPTKTWQVTVGCNDIFDAASDLKIDYRDYSDKHISVNPEYPLAGRTFFVNARYDF
ncbi:TonB-dependent siderophore receptor [Sporomusa sp. KB1]|uniref:TonB-dependent receptor plug domain-containing protein n=1 Tax=Sporomusa sp. KB1 TaxID=943346 RepID=UPI002107BA90|nr:TonB-dependent receptor [Sporomusa sp. KB1]